MQSLSLYRNACSWQLDIENSIMYIKNKKGGNNMADTINVGNTILQRAFIENVDITPMKLQKLLYCLYKEYYKRTKRPLFGERFEAWKYGPVLPSIYAAFKQYGSNSIKNYARDASGKIYVVDMNSSIDFWNSFYKVWELYKNVDGIVLSSYTHRADSAWRKAIDARRPYLLDQDIEEERDFA